MRPWKLLPVLAAAAATAAFIAATRGPDPPTPNPPGALVFGALGDAPYYTWEVLQHRLVLQQIAASDLAFVIHVGDIFWHRCSDENYRWILDGWKELPHPVVYTPGDNETFDCWEPGVGGYAPQERFAAVRRIFFADPARSLGGKPMPLASQGGEFLENARWTQGGVVFATADMIGSRNGMKPFPARTTADDEAARRRTEAATTWVKATFAEARRTDAPAVVLAFHAALRLEPPDRRLYEPFFATVEDEAEAFRRPVLLVHGDGHKYTVDRPLRPQNLTRLQVPGSPRVGWVKIAVQPGAKEPFTFERHALPRWKYW